jgi:IS30 family transposase
MRSYTQLTPDEIHTMRLLRAEGRPLKNIARRLNRACSVVHRVVSDIQKGDRESIGARRDRVVIPDDVAEERNRRLATPPRDLTASQMGDPLPGWSALERSYGR